MPSNPDVFTRCGGWWIPKGDEPIRQGRLDELLRNGLVLPPPKESGDGLIVMIRGKAGTGKSTLMLQLAANIRLAVGGDRPPWQFLSLEQDGDELGQIYCRMVTQQCLAALSLRKSSALEKTKNGDVVEMVVREFCDLLDVDPAPANTGKFQPAFAAALELASVDPAARLDPLDLAAQLDEKTQELIESAARTFASAQGDVQKWFIPSGHSNGRAEPGLKDDPLSRAYRFVEEQGDPGDRMKRRILYIDGLSTLSGEDRVRLEMGSLIDSLRKRCLIGIIGFEPGCQEDEYLDHQVDIVIELEEKHIENPIDYLVHELHIKKSRYQEAALGWHQYKIRNYGIEIYPSLHFQVHSHLYMTRQLVDSLLPVTNSGTPRDEQKPNAIAENSPPQNAQTNEPAVSATAGAAGESSAPATLQNRRAGPDGQGYSVLERILGRINEGDSVALLGARGTFKTALTLDFLLRSGPFGCPNSASGAAGDLGLLVSLIDNEKTLREGQHCPLARQCQCSVEKERACLQHVFLFYQRPGCISAAEFLYYLKTRLQLGEKSGKPIKRLAFWDLTQLEYRFPLLANDPMFVPALLDLFKSPKSENQRIKSVFMGAANARLTDAISAMADNVVFCWRDRIREKYKPPENQGIENDHETRRIASGLQAKVENIWAQMPLCPAKSAGRWESEYLMLYVDRTSGGIGNEKKGLFAFPVLRTPDIENKQKGGSKLLMPGAKEWVASTFEMDPDLHVCFDQTLDQIQKVDALQGLEGEFRLK